MNRLLARLSLLVPLLLSLAIGCAPSSASSQCAAQRALRRANLTVVPELGSAMAFAALGGTAVNNSGRTDFTSESGLTADVGVSPGNAISGMCATPPNGCGATGVIDPPSTEEIADTAAAQAQIDATAAYNALASDSCVNDKSGVLLGGTLTPGVYCFSSAASISGNLNLDAQGNPNAVFIFQIGTTLTTAANTFVELINGGSTCNIFWQVGTSATLGTNTQLLGNLLAKGDITMNAGVNLVGRAISQSGALTLDSDTFQVNSCAAASTDGGVVDGGSPDAGDESDAGSLGSCGD